MITKYVTYTNHLRIKVVQVEKETRQYVYIDRGNGAIARPKKTAHTTYHDTPEAAINALLPRLIAQVYNIRLELEVLDDAIQSITGVKETL